MNKDYIIFLKLNYNFQKNQLFGNIFPQSLSSVSLYSEIMNTVQKREILKNHTYLVSFSPFNQTGRQSRNSVLNKSTKAAGDCHSDSTRLNSHSTSLVPFLGGVKTLLIVLHKQSLKIYSLFPSRIVFELQFMEDCTLEQCSGHLLFCLSRMQILWPPVSIAAIRRCHMAWPFVSILTGCQQSWPMIKAEGSFTKG